MKEPLPVVPLTTYPLTVYRCQRCPHVWVPRTPEPVKCPRCGNPYWNKPRRKR